MTTLSLSKEDGNSLVWGERGEDQGDPAGFAAGKAGCRGTSPFPETICKKKRLVEKPPEQNLGLRKIVGIRERKCRVKRERVSHEQHYFMQRRA